MARRRARFPPPAGTSGGACAGGAAAAELDAAQLAPAPMAMPHGRAPVHALHRAEALPGRRAHDDHPRLARRRRESAAHLGRAMLDAAPPPGRASNCHALVRSARSTGRTGGRGGQQPLVSDSVLRRGCRAPPPSMPPRLGRARVGQKTTLCRPARGLRDRAGREGRSPTTATPLSSATSRPYQGARAMADARTATAHHRHARHQDGQERELSRMSSPQRTAAMPPPPPPPPTPPTPPTPTPHPPPPH